MHSRAKRFVIVAVAAGLLIILSWAIVHHREPVYDGKPLSSWAQQYGSNHWSARRASANEAEFAIQQIGTNSIPFLLNLMRATDPPLTRKLRTILPRKWHTMLRLKDESGKIRRIGAHGLAALGTNAQPALPLLLSLLDHPESRVHETLANALPRIKPPPAKTGGNQSQ